MSPQKLKSLLVWKAAAENLGPLLPSDVPSHGPRGDGRQEPHNPAQVQGQGPGARIPCGTSVQVPC